MNVNRNLLVHQCRGILSSCATAFCILASMGSAGAQTLTTFRIANGTSGENPAALWVGVEQGFFRKHGLNLEVIYMRTGSLAVSALASGDVQTVLTSSNAVLNIAAGGLDVAIIGNLFNRPDGDFMARPEIKRPEELKGKYVAIQSIGGGGWANNMLALDYLGLDPERDKIHFIVLGDQPSRIQALETDRAQASWMGATFSAPLKKKGFTLLLDLARAPIPYVGSSLVIKRSVGAPGAENLRGVAQGHHRLPAVLSETGKQTEVHADPSPSICGYRASKTPKPAITRWSRPTAATCGRNLKASKNLLDSGAKQSQTANVKAGVDP